MIKPIIFLDIDGVLVTKPFREINHTRTICNDTAVYNLNMITNTVDANIVLSSAWRFNGLLEMQAVLKTWGVTANLIGLTPDLASQDSRGVWAQVRRGQEIKAYLEGEKLIVSSVPFIIIDDNDDMEDLHDHLVHTKYSDGLTKEKAFDAITLFNNQMY
jgi:hypothetical protein